LVVKSWSASSQDWESIDLARVRPFPWHSFEVLTRAEVRAWNDLRQWVATHARLDDLGRALESVVGARCEVIPRGIRIADLRDLDGTGLRVVLHRAQSDDPLDSLLIDVEPALAAHAVGRATKREMTSPITQTPVSANIAGAFAAVLATALRRVHTDMFLSVASAGATADLASALAARETRFVIARFTIVLGDDVFDARIAAAQSGLARVPTSPWSRRRLAGLGPVPLSLPLVVCCLPCSASQWADIEPGDALVIPSWPLQRTQGKWIGGPVWLAAPSAEVGVRALFDEKGQLVLGSELDSLDGMASPMGAEDVDAVVTTAGDAVVSLRVELAHAVMPARDWAALGPGAIVMLGSRVGEPVVIRVGGIPVARGDLINVDGEVGVRIVERHSDLQCR